MKKIIVAISLAVATLSFPAHAASTKTMVIIDTGADTANTSIKNNIVYEACFAGYNSCPNGKTFMEGAGAATITPAMYSNEAWGHGTKVISAAIQTDPNVKIIEVRCASLINTNGYIGCNSTMLTNALNWVYDNKDKLNAGIVVSPLGSFSATCDVNASYVAPINKIVSSGIAVMFPTGNDFKYTSIDNPACVPGVLAISAIDDKGRLALYANYSSRVDFASNGNLTVSLPGGATKSDYGTSLSVATFGASWLKILNLKSLSIKDEYALIKSTGTNYTNIMVKQNVVAINLQKAVQ